MVNAGLVVTLLKPRWIALALVTLDLILVLVGQTGILVLVLTSGLGIWGVVALGSMLFRRSRIIWRLRNRLIVTYVFIAVVPTLLLLALVFIGGYFVTGQMAAYLVNTALDRRAEALASPARVLSQTSADEQAQEAIAIAAVLREPMPGLRIFVSGTPDYQYPADGTLSAPDAAWNTTSTGSHPSPDRAIPAILERPANRRPFRQSHGS